MQKINLFFTRALLLIVAGVAANFVNANDGIHQPFTEVLKQSVVNGQVNYKAIKNNLKFKAYIKTLEANPTFTNKDEELAYWINAYNALAIKGILDGKSPKSLFGRLKYFKKAKYNVGGENINLFDLERKVIIPLGEPRIHFAINCASGSCPKLLPKAYTAATLENDLEKVTIDFVNDEFRNNFDKNRNIANLSKIFDWFKEDFAKHSGSVQKYIAQYIDDPEIAEALKQDSYKIRYLKYDWNLNGTAP